MGKLCQLLEISRSGYYAWLRGGESARKTANQALLRELVRLHEKYPALGLDSLYHMLKPAFHCSRGRVHRLMKAAGIHSQRNRAYKATTNSRHNCPIAPNLLQRQFTFTRPNQAWVGDITYIPTREGWLYLAAVIDAFSRKVVGWSMSERITEKVAIDAMEQAVGREGPPDDGSLVFHDDRGAQYTSRSFQRCLDSHGIVQSVSRPGTPLDNAVAESFFKTLKRELVKERSYGTRDEAKQDIFKYIELYYNRVRMHSTLDYMSPVEYERQYA